MISRTGWARVMSRVLLTESSIRLSAGGASACRRNIWLTRQGRSQGLLRIGQPGHSRHSDHRDSEKPTVAPTNDRNEHPCFIFARSSSPGHHCPRLSTVTAPPRLILIVCVTTIAAAPRPSDRFCRHLKKIRTRAAAHQIVEHLAGASGRSRTAGALASASPASSFRAQLRKRQDDSGPSGPQPGLSAPAPT